MSEEEKEAIDDCKNFMNVGDYIGEKEYKELQIAINYIEKLQTKYEKQKKINLEENQFIDTQKTNIIKLQKENKELKEELDYYKQKESQEFDERDYYEE